MCMCKHENKYLNNMVRNAAKEEYHLVQVNKSKTRQREKKNVRKVKEKNWTRRSVQRRIVFVLVGVCVCV